MNYFYGKDIKILQEQLIQELDIYFDIDTIVFKYEEFSASYSAGWLKVSKEENKEFIKFMKEQVDNNKIEMYMENV